MALETVSTIYDLVSTNPTSGDPKSQGDDHLRNIKLALLASFAGNTATGEYKLGKLNVKMGTATTNAGLLTVTFTTPFATSCHGVLAGNKTSSTSGITIFAGSESVSGFSLASSSGAGLTVFWVAFGY